MRERVEVAADLASIDRVEVLQVGQVVDDGTGHVAGRMDSTVLYAYRFDASDFRPFGTPVAHAMVASVVVRPLGPPERVGSLLAAHAAAEIEPRVLASPRPYVGRVVGSSVGFSGIRLRNART